MAAASTDLLGAMAAGKDGPLVVFVASISLTTYVYIYMYKCLGEKKTSRIRGTGRGNFPCCRGGVRPSYLSEDLGWRFSRKTSSKGVLCLLLP